MMFHRLQVQMVGSIRNLPCRLPACAAIVLLAAAPLAPAAEPPAASGRLEALDLEPLSIATADGKRHDFRVYVARTSAEKREGLMFVESLAADRGMMFLYRPPRVVSMWMKNTPLSLDMLFVRDDGAIESIAIGTQPWSEQQYRSEAPVSAVIELNAGIAETLGIERGDRIIHPWFER